MSNPQDFDWIGGLQGSARVRVDQIAAYTFDHDNGSTHVYNVRLAGGDWIQIHVPAESGNPIEPLWNPRQ